LLQNFLRLSSFFNLSGQAQVLSQRPIPIIKPKPILKKVSAPTVDPTPKNFGPNRSRSISEQSPIATGQFLLPGKDFSVEHRNGVQQRPNPNPSPHPTKGYPSSSTSTTASSAGSSQTPSLSSVATSSSSSSASNKNSKVPMQRQRSREATEPRRSEITKPPSEKLTITVNLVKPVPNAPPALTSQQRNQRMVRKH